MALIDNIADIRRNYARQVLTEDSVAHDPVLQFKSWLQEAIDAAVEEPTAMMLSTVNAAGRPAARVLLLKDVTTEGFTFFTNYDSRKGHELLQNPYAAMTFFWPCLERQVRIEGRVVKVAPEVSDRYFQSRPKGSRIGAWASPQSRQVSSRQELEEAEKQYAATFAQTESIPRPEHWGGYVLQPDYIEFWQGRPNRLHDRIAFVHEASTWQVKRLAP